MLFFTTNNNSNNESKLNINEIHDFFERRELVENKQIQGIDILKLVNFENDIQKRLIGQDEAIRTVSGAIKRAAVGLNIKHKPIGSFIFCGPTGVGKTEMAKTLAKNLFESSKSLIRFDMSEYMDKHSSSKLLGTSPGYVGYEREGVLTQKIKDNPEAVLLFDEIEKSDKQLMDLFLQVLDEGILRDSKDNVISFKDTIVILTSNIGASLIFDYMKNKTNISDLDKSYISSKVIEKLLERFRPEFINRLDQIVVFQPLVKDTINKILFKQLTEKEKLLENNLKIEIIRSKEAYEFLLKKGFDLRYGARQVSRTLEQLFEAPLIDFVARNTTTLTRPDHVKITFEGGELLFSV